MYFGDYAAMQNIQDFSPTISPEELRIILNILSEAPVKLGQAHSVSLVLDKLVGMANKEFRIGSIEPVKAEEEAPPGDSVA